MNAFETGGYIFLTIGMIGWIYECVITMCRIYRFIRREIRIRYALKISNAILNDMVSQ